MRLNELRPNPGARKSRKRLGRGDASGHGGTSTRGHKGQKARTGGYHKRGFEGGQMPLARRLPKRGFTNIDRREVAVVNLDQLQNWPSGTMVTPETLVAHGLIPKRHETIKLLARGDAPSKLTVRLAAVSVAAKAKVESAGGVVEDPTVQ
ncbi:MAG: 50S ribosomal protein L15 [Deltaproteobacteria bacterium]|nr:50S ribosomal protein L15 [Deltaproteobacteria bacterium]